MHSGVMHKHNIHMSTPVIDTLVMYAYMEHLVSHVRMFSYVSVYYSFKVQKGTLWGSVFSTHVGLCFFICSGSFVCFVQYMEYLVSPIHMLSYEPI